MLQKLLETHQIKLEDHDSSGSNPLMLSALTGSEEMLLMHAVDPWNNPSSIEHFQLELHHSPAAMVKFLLERGCNINARDHWGRTGFASVYFG